MPLTHQVYQNKITVYCGEDPATVPHCHVYAKDQLGKRHTGIFSLIDFALLQGGIPDYQQRLLQRWWNLKGRRELPAIYTQLNPQQGKWSAEEQDTEPLQHALTPCPTAITATKGEEIQCLFNNGESRRIHLPTLFRAGAMAWPSSPTSKARIRNHTLSWKGPTGQDIEPDPRLVYQSGIPVAEMHHRLQAGSLFRAERRAAGLTQSELAARSGTGKAYISRLESGKIEPEWSTLNRIAEQGLQKKLEIKMTLV